MKKKQETIAQYERPCLSAAEFASEQGFAASGTPAPTSMGGTLGSMSSTNGGW